MTEIVSSRLHAVCLSTFEAMGVIVASAGCRRVPYLSEHMLCPDVDLHFSVGGAGTSLVYSFSVEISHILGDWTSMPKEQCYEGCWMVTFAVAISSIYPLCITQILHNNATILTDDAD